MAKNQLPDQETLKRLLRYDPKTGQLFWKRRKVSEFAASAHTAAHTCAKWNARWAYKEALTKVNLGYRCGRLNYEYVLAHRVIWKLVTGEDPHEVDHIDGNRANNAWKNLRNVTPESNRRNTARRRDNTSGVVGVTWNAQKGRWAAFIVVSGKMLNLGLYRDFETAIRARREAEAEHGFHANHGRTPLT